MSERVIRIGCGAGFSGDRIEPAVELAQRGDLDYLVFECLAERTIALAQKSKLQNADASVWPSGEDARQRGVSSPVRNERITAPEEPSHTVIPWRSSLATMRLPETS